MDSSLIYVQWVRSSGRKRALPNDIVAQSQAHHDALTSADPSLVELFAYPVEVVNELAVSGY